MPGHQNPTVRRKELGAALRTLRTSAGLGIDDVARELDISTSQVSRIETGQRNAKRRDVREMCDLYVADDNERERLLKLTEEVRGAGWWAHFDTQMVGDYTTYIGLEDGARRIRDYKPDIIAGLLQTADYARAIIGAARPRRADAAIEEQVKLRLGRQEILRRSSPPPPVLEAIMDEAALHRLVGDTSTMRLQLAGLLEANDLSSVSLRVIPLKSGPHSSLGNAYTILSLPQHEVRDVVYIEGLEGQRYIERPRDVQRYAHVFDSLDEFALPEDETNVLIRTLRDELYP